jgi:integrase
LRLPPPEEQKNLDALGALLESRGLDAADFIDTLNLLSAIKKRDEEKATKEAEEPKEKELKIFGDKEYVFETRTDVFIYRDNRTKSGRYYVRIYDARTKKVHSESLRTTNRIEALAAAERLYREKRDKLTRGVKMVSINTKELIGIYLRTRFKERTNIPHTGITYASYDNLIKKLKYWEDFINYYKHKKTKIENIPPELAKGFAIWIKEQPKQFYQGRQRSNETINQVVSAVKKMYKDIALEEKYITLAEFPNFKTLKVQRDSAPKRDVLETEEKEEIQKFLQYKYTREKGIDDNERLKRRQFAFLFTIHYATGARNKELLGLRWRDISIIKGEREELKRINRALFIPPENSKTGKGRHIVSPIADTLERMKKMYIDNGIECGRDDFIFPNLAKTKRNQNIPYAQPAIEKRLAKVLEQSGLGDKLEKDGRRITLYSARHYYATDALMRKVDIYTLSLNMGTSISYISSTYSHITTMMKSEEITQSQGYHKVLDERGIKALKSVTEEGFGD